MNGESMTPDHIIFASYGNDSIALIQWAYEKGLRNVVVAYSETGWGTYWWEGRVLCCEAWVRSLGFTPVRIPSMGMAALVIKERGWPQDGMQFCTEKLKILPAMAWMDEVDPDKEAVCLSGVRREESYNRSDAPEWVEASNKHGGRSLWQPLVFLNEIARNTLVVRAGFDVLPHRSKECEPCINANKDDLAMMHESDVVKTEAVEAAAGFTKKGKPRVAFRPAKKMGAVGIRAIIAWANSPRGRYHKDQGYFDLRPSSGCNSGWCGG